MKKLSFAILSFLVIFLTLNQTACSEHSIELQKLDSLDHTLNSVDSMLDIDVDLLRKRSDLIGKQRGFILKNYKDTFSYELGSQLAKYKVLMKRYKEYSGKQVKFDGESKALRLQIADLRAYYHSSEYSKEEFKTYLRTERSDILTLHSESSKMRTSLYELEPEYYRVSDYIDAHIEVMLAQDTTLHL